LPCACKPLRGNGPPDGTWHKDGWEPNEWVDQLIVGFGRQLFSFSHDAFTIPLLVVVLSLQ
jgi:hypothetical protein